MSNKDIVNRYEPEDWGGLHMAPKPNGNWVSYEEWEKVSAQLATLKEENERLKSDFSWYVDYANQKQKHIYALEGIEQVLKARVAELEKKA